MTRGTEPRTEAGRALLVRLGWFASEKGDALREGVLATEAEARSQLIEEAIAGVEGLRKTAVSLDHTSLNGYNAGIADVLALLRGLQESR
jgi:hypothetical protein